VPCWSVGEVVYMRTRTKEILSPEDFAVFARLRELRKEIAQVEAVPVYTIFTNEQLAQIVQAKAATKGDLEKVAGVGDARIEKYGPRFLEHLRGQWRRTDEAGGQSV
jgi:superfamily II DNA helicase RecQ